VAVHATEVRGAVRKWAAVAIGLAALAVLAIIAALTRRPRRRRVQEGSPVVLAALGNATRATSVPKRRADGAVAPRPKIKRVVVDQMGVLFREADDVEALLIPFVRERGGIDDALAIRAHYVDTSVGKHTSAQLWSLLEVPGDPAALDRALVSRLTLNDHVEDFLDSMERRRIPVSCITNDVAEWSRLTRRRFGFEGRIDPWIVSGEQGVRKPEPEIFSALRALIDEPFDVCMFIDDNFVNLDTARRLGMATVQMVATLTEGSPHRQIRSLAALVNKQSARSQ
jgi:FMN phosphatase YigB (HAD superfamily)